MATVASSEARCVTSVSVSPGRAGFSPQLALSYDSEHDGAGRLFRDILRVGALVGVGVDRIARDVGARFCEDCGARLEAACPSCGTPVTPGSVAIHATDISQEGLRLPDDGPARKSPEAPRAIPTGSAPGSRSRDPA